jgi:acyl carrier protein
MEERLIKVFSETFGIPIDSITYDLKYAGIPQWDSVAHMALIVALEDEFDIMIETDDVIDMSNYKKAEDIVNKYL